MEHSLPLISTLVIAFSLALVFGFIAERFLKSPALVGYLLAGVAAGQYTPGVYADPALAHQLSEIGVMLLMFGVGLHFSVKDLMSVRSIALPGAVLQMSIATVLGMGIAHFFWDWSWGEALVFGLSLSCASTVVLLKALDVRGVLTTSEGRIAVGWLVVEDIATVLILVLLPPLSGMLGGADAAAASTEGGALWWQILRTIINVIAFVAVMMVVGRKALPWLMGQVARTGSRELFTLFVLGCALGVAYGAAEIFHVSFALGAFFAGMVMRESRFAHRAATESLPLQDAFAVLFFVGCGMLFDWHILVDAPLEILCVLFIILFGKSIAAFFLVIVLRHPLATALTVSAALAQIGEFSFILVAQAMSLGLAERHMMNLIVGGSILSIALNPVMFALVPKAGELLAQRFKWAKHAALRDAPFEVLSEEAVPERMVGQTILVGSGLLVERMAASLRASDRRIVVVTKDVALAERLSAEGIAVLQGDAADPHVLVMAHGATAKRIMLFDATPQGVRILETARTLQPGIPVTIVAPDPGLWAEVKAENLRFLSSEEAAAEGLACAFLAARKAGEEPGAPTGRPVKAQAEEEQNEEDEKSEKTEERPADKYEGRDEDEAARTPEFAQEVEALRASEASGADAPVRPSASEVEPSDPGKVEEKRQL